MIKQAPVQPNDSPAPIDEKQIKKALHDAITIVRGNTGTFTRDFKDEITVNNFYNKSENVGWTTGFCTGEYWLAYEMTGEPVFRKAALVQVDSFMHRAQNRIKVDHHDMGFLYTPSCVAAWMLDKSETGRGAALLAADILLERYQQVGRFIQAWGALGAADNYRLIIDCLMNLPLLYWASEQTGDDKYREHAIVHTQTTLANIVREDGSTYHTYFFDPATGAPLRGATAQGYRNDSTWARGQAWAVYGSALAYRHTGEAEYIEVFEKVAQHFITRLPVHLIPYWDMTFTEGDEPWDSSAGAIAACGMLEMAGHLPKEKAGPYIDMALRMAASLAEHCAVQDISTSNGLLQHGVYARQSPYNNGNDYGVDECNTWGDYFWLELLVRLGKDWKPYW